MHLPTRERERKGERGKGEEVEVGGEDRKRGRRERGRAGERGRERERAGESGREREREEERQRGRQRERRGGR